MTADRVPVTVRPASSRTFEQRLSLRFPRLAVALLRVVLSRPPSSRLRQASLARGIGQAAEAYNRLDLEAAVIGWDPALEYYPARPLVEAGLIQPCYRGHAGYRRYVADAAEVWGSDTRFEPTELIDLGDRLVILARAPMRAQASGVPLTLEFAYVSTFKDGMTFRLQEFHDHAEALASVGLRE